MHLFRVSLKELLQEENGSNGLETGELVVLDYRKGSLAFSKGLGEGEFRCNDNRNISCNKLTMRFQSETSL